jgi:PAS domain-containing protein
VSAQLALDFAEPATPEPTWVTGQLPDLSGVAQYVIMIRAPGDPDRLPRELMKKDTLATWRRTLMKQPVEGIAEALRQHLDDGEPRTMNRAAVEMIDKTADLVGGTPFEDALWHLVERGELEFTMAAPVLFRKPKAIADTQAQVKEGAHARS